MCMLLLLVFPVLARLSHARKQQHHCAALARHAHDVWHVFPSTGMLLTCTQAASLRDSGRAVVAPCEAKAELAARVWA